MRHGDVKVGAWGLGDYNFKKGALGRRTFWAERDQQLQRP